MTVLGLDPEYSGDRFHLEIAFRTPPCSVFKDRRQKNQDLNASSAKYIKLTQLLQKTGIFMVRKEIPQTYLTHDDRIINRASGSAAR